MESSMAVKRAPAASNMVQWNRPLNNTEHPMKAADQLRAGLKISARAVSRVEEVNTKP